MRLVCPVSNGAVWIPQEKEKILIKHLPLAFFVCGLAVRLSAGAITILNPSFEADVLGCAAGPSCQNLDAITDWTGSSAYPGGFNGNFSQGGQFGVLEPSSAGFSSIPNGVNVAYLGGAASNVSISQSLSGDLLANDTYTLTVFIGEEAGIAASGDGLQNGQCNGFNASLEAGGNVLNSLVAAGNASCNSLSAGAFTEFTLTYTSGASPAGLGDPLQIVLTENGSGSVFEPAELDFDAVGLSDTSSVGGSAPEPATFAMMAVGLVALGVRVRRSRG
jgi:hypothetical protein